MLIHGDGDDGDDDDDGNDDGDEEDDNGDDGDNDINDNKDTITMIMIDQNKTGHWGLTTHIDPCITYWAPNYKQYWQLPWLK